jgi:Xaa-Pro dipeptidase
VRLGVSTDLFGVREPGGYGIINVDTGRSTLFVERLPESYQMWMGKHKTLEDFKAIYEVDEVRWHDEVATVLGDLDIKPTVYVMNGANADSGSAFTEPEYPDKDKYTVDRSARLFNAVIEARVFKTDAELEVGAVAKRSDRAWQWSPG